MTEYIARKNKDTIYANISNKKSSTLKKFHKNKKFHLKKFPKY